MREARNVILSNDPSLTVQIIHLTPYIAIDYNPNRLIIFVDK